ATGRFNQDSPAPAMREREGPTPQAWEGEGLFRRKLAKNRQDYALGVRQDVVVPEPEHPPALAFEPSGAAAIRVVVGMLTAVCLDDHAMSGAREIDDVVADRVLRAKPIA